MEESVGSQYALQVALQTMKERCQNLQKRVTNLEEENLSLKLKCTKTQDNKECSLNEVDLLRRKVAELSEEKSQLRSNVAMVASENRQLWNRLSKLTQDNKSLGSKLSKINETITQHNKGHTPLIRSKTFTQDAPHTKHLQKALMENDKISLELEDISLKLLTSISKEKSELEMQCSEMAQLQSAELLSNSFGFAYLGEESEDSMADDFEQHLNDLKVIKATLQLDKEKLLKNISNLQTLRVEECKKCSAANKSELIVVKEEEDDYLETNMQLESLAQWGSMNNSEVFPGVKNNKSAGGGSDNVCPMCSRRFTQDSEFDVFVKHVEAHFTAGLLCD